MKKFILLSTVIAISVGSMPMFAQAGFLADESVSITSSAGLGGTGTSASDMVYQTYQTNGDGWGWAGGAGSVQGSQSINNSGKNAAAANEALSFNVGSLVTSLNTQYGAGDWTVSNVSLAFASSYSVQNNSRFGVGSGTFDIYWIANNNWKQSAGTATNPGLNPPYASSAAALAAWSGGQADLASETFTVPTGGSGYVNLSYGLGSNTSLVNEITSASTTGNEAVSLYLMATNPNLGMIIFTGGQAQALPTLSFEVDSVTPTPIPAAVWLLGSGLFGLVGLKRKNVRA
jgi:hypothetical protein